MSVVAAGRSKSANLQEVLAAVKPRAGASNVANDESDPVIRILSVLLNSRFRKGSLAAMDAGAFVARHRDRLALRVARNEPVLLTLVGFPFKVPNPLRVADRTLPDLAEVAALRTLEKLHFDVQQAYSPGIQVVILHDGAYIADAFGVPQRETHEYAKYFRSLLRATGTDAFVRCEDLGRLLDADGREDPAAATVPNTGDGDAPAFRKTLGMLNVRWIRRDALAGVYQTVLEGDPACFTGEAAVLYQQARRCMARYAACDALLHRCDPRPHAFPDAIHATTKQQPGRLALWLVRRGRALLPWHGVGVLDRTGRIEVRYAADVDARIDYRPVFLEGETTPFFYEQLSS
jgi:L-tyrosine isonitrile synthase